MYIKHDSAGFEVVCVMRGCVMRGRVLACAYWTTY